MHKILTLSCTKFVFYGIFIFTRQRTFNNFDNFLTFPGFFLRTQTQTMMMKKIKSPAPIMDRAITSSSPVPSTENT